METSSSTTSSPSSKHPRSTHPTVEVEVALRPTSSAKRNQVTAYLEQHIKKYVAIFKNGPIDFSKDMTLKQHVEKIQVYLPESKHTVPVWEAKVIIHVYRLAEEVGSEEMEGDGEDDVTACETWSLPARDFDNYWDNLILEKSVKERLLRFSYTSMLFADKKVNPSIISCNRVVLLYGPPGTGKTTLCKALAQKLSIRLSGRYSNSMLLEINAHSLFSKWFSESGKLVMKLFEKIHDLVEDKDSLVCVLIDEVESLAANRQGGSGDPSDAIRAVNALLTQLDKLKIYENVIILATSNITEAIDLAFIDRADIKQYIGLPGLRARYEIIRSCTGELIRKGILQDAKDNSTLWGDNEMKKAESHGKDSLTSKIESLAHQTDGFSGRTLRKLPFKCHAVFVRSQSTTALEFLDFMAKTVEMEKEDRKKLVRNEPQQ